MKTLVFWQNQRNMKYLFSAASRKAKKYAFSHGKMHISDKSWNHQKCIIPWKPLFLDKINEIWNMHFLQPAEKKKQCAFSHGKMHISEKSWSHQKCIIPWKPWFLNKINEIWNMHFLQPAEKQKKICIFPWKNAYFWKILEPSKMHIENAYFLRAIKNAYWKCIFFACYFYGRSKMHNGSGRPTFLICTVSPKAVLWRFFSACFSLRHLNVTQQVWQQILIPALQSQLEPSVPYSGTLKDMDLHGLSSIQT